VPHTEGPDLPEAPASPRHVVHVITRLTTGSAGATIALCAGLSSRGIDVTLVHGHNPPHEPSARRLLQQENVVGISVAAMGPSTRGLRDLRALWMLRRIIRQIRPEVVHTHTAKAGVLGRVAALLAMWPRPVIVHTFHGHVLTGYFGAARSAAFRTIERVLARTTDRVIAPSQATAGELLALGVVRRGQCVVIRYGFDLTAFRMTPVAERAKTREELGIPGNAVVLLFSGRLAPIKRLDVLIEAAAILREQGVAFRLLLAGEGECRSDLERRADARGVRPQVSFLGHREDIARLTGAADVAVLTSDNEGLPIALIEAGAAGLPAVATEAGGTPEVITDETGLLVPRQDAEALAAALRQLIDDGGLRSALGRASRERAQRLFARESMVEATERLYAHLLVEKKRRPAGERLAG
jgi:glycosyltransferase involved in cell wall biosynthesis